MHRLYLILMGVVLAACGNETAVLDVPSPDATVFASDVYPILLRDCGFPACHGARGRFFQVLGPGRTRELPMTLPDDPATPTEVMFSYTRARSMLANDGSVLESLLLRKPLDKNAGGAGHKGDDNWGRNVYASKTDPAYVLLLRWALASEAVPAAQGTP